MVPAQMVVVVEEQAFGGMTQMEEQPRQVVVVDSHTMATMEARTGGDPRGVEVRARLQ